MLCRFRRLRHILPKIYPGTLNQLSGRDINVLASRSSVLSLNVSDGVRGRVDWSGFEGQRYSTVSKAKRKQRSEVDILAFIRSSLHVPKGPSHCWLNMVADSKALFKGDGLFLVLVGEHVEGSLEANLNTVKMFEKAKSLQQRHPLLQVLALLHSKSICENDVSAYLHQRIIKEYVTFPILLYNQNTIKMENTSCYIVSKGLQNSMVYPVEDEDLKMLDKAIRDLNGQNGKKTNVNDTKSNWVKSTGPVKEPDICAASRNLLFSFPGCISVDESDNRLFLSDVNHHRIVVFDSNGKVLDAIGSSPGFEDGEFENAKLMRPAASFYDASEDCLYFVDSENNAIRRADMESRFVETIFPDGGRKNKGLWKWILDKIWTKPDVKLQSDEINSESFMFPWHLLKSSDNNLIVLNQSFQTLWIIDMESGLIKEVVKESSKILEICGQLILEKCTPLRQIPDVWLQQQVDSNFTFEGIPHAGLMSSAATCQDHTVFCDPVGQTVVKFCKGSDSATSFQFSNFGILGLPYWLSSSLERVYTVDDVQPGINLDHSQSFHLSPGKVEIEFNVQIPQHTDLVEQPQEGCIWRQARGAAAEVSGVEINGASSEKVGVAQQWYDEIDGLAFSAPEEEEMSTEEETKPSSAAELQEGRVRIDCTINISPGTSEAIIYAALYLRLKRNTDPNHDSQEKKAAKIADILDPKRKFRKDLLIKLMMMSSRDLEELVFVRPLHTRIKFHTCDHPKADNSKDIVLSDSSVKVHITL